MNRLWIIALVQVVSGVLSGPDPAQMEKAADLGYRAAPSGVVLPEGMPLGAPSSVAIDAHGHLLVFTRAEKALMEFDLKTGALVKAFGDGRYVRSHGMRVDSAGNIWTTDVNGHTVTKMSPEGEVLLTLGTKGRPGTGTRPPARVSSTSRTISGSRRAATS